VRDFSKDRLESDAQRRGSMRFARALTLGAAISFLAFSVTDDAKQLAINTKIEITSTSYASYTAIPETPVPITANPTVETPSNKPPLPALRTGNLIPSIDDVQIKTPRTFNPDLPQTAKNNNAHPIENRLKTAPESKKVAALKIKPASVRQPVQPRRIEKTPEPQAGPEIQPNGLFNTFENNTLPCLKI